MKIVSEYYIVLKLSTVSLMLAVAFFFAISTANAIEYGGIGGKPANPDPANPRTESVFIYELEPNESKEDEFLVVNNTTETKTLLVYATDSQKSTDGSFACEQFSDEKDLVGKWINLEQSEVILEPSTNVTIPFTITVPENASVGEINGCIFVQEKKAQNPEASGVSLSFRTGTRVVVTVPGEQVRKLEIITFEVEKLKSTIFSKLEIENKGNVSIDTNIKLHLDYIWGTNNFTVDNQNIVLRGEVGTFNIEIPRPKWGGIFKLKSEVSYDPSDEAKVGFDSENPNTILETETKYLLIMPGNKELAIELAILILILTVVGFTIRKYVVFKRSTRDWSTYIVKDGDTINKLSDNYNVSWKLVAKVNKLKAPYQLVEGMKIKLPRK